MSLFRCAMMAAAAASAPPAFSYDDVPNQLLRINSLEGSLAGSGGVLTSVTDVSGAGEAITVTSTPTYTASDAGLGGAPSFTPGAGGAIITAPGVDVDAVLFVAAVMYMAASTCYVLSSSDGTRSVWRQENNGRFTGGPAGFATVESGGGVAGRKRLLAPLDGSAQLQWNGALYSFSSTGVWTGTPAGMVLGSSSTGAFASRVAFFMACSAVPSAPLLASLEAKLLADFG